MRIIEKIGVIFDINKGNEMALEEANQLAKVTEANLHLLCPIDRPIPEETQESIKKHLSLIISEPYELSFLQGNAVNEILTYTHSNDLDLLILEPTLQTGIKQFFFGSLALFLIRRAACPVWVVKKPRPQTYERVLIAVDPLHDKEGAASLNDKLIELGCFIAKHLGAECHLVSAWHLAGESSMSDSPFYRVSEEEIQKFNQEERENCSKAFNALCERHKKSLQDTSLHLLNAEPGVAIANFIQENHIDIVVMGTVARTGIKGFVVGNTAETILNQIECSVIAVKPDFFPV